MIVGAPHAEPHGSYSGASYVVFGQATGFAANLDLSSLDGSNGFKLSGVAAGDFSGNSVASAGDINGDGFDDLIVGAPNGPDSLSAGASYVVFGQATGFDANLDLSTLDGSNGFKLSGVAEGDGSSYSVASAGDVNGDGFDDLIVGAMRADPHGLSSGASYVVFGRPPDAAVNRVGTNASQTLAGGAFNDTLSGLGGDDRLFGHGGNDTLNGGAGADAMTGGAGNDVYAVDSAGDRVTENAGDGTDLVQSLITYTLRANVENLTLIGTANIEGTGNAAANTIIGNSGDNALSGGVGNDTLRGESGNDRLDGYAGNDTLNGGAGDDTLDGDGDADAMTGGAGNDTYVVDNVGDSVTESPGEGSDRVRSLISYSLGANVEHLFLIGSANIDGTGNTRRNAIIGNPGDNVLSCGDGDDTLRGEGGNDTLNGGAGADSFLFNTALNAATNVGTVVDFNTVSDKILLENSIFTAAGAPGTLAANAFFTGASAHDADDRIIYNNATGALNYDPDGIGAASGTQFAILSTGLALTNTHFQIA